MNRFLPQEPSSKLLRTIRKADIRTEYDPEKHRLTLLNEAGQEPLYFRLPLTLPFPYATQATESIHYVILLIQSGNCALGYFENGRCLNHKVFRSYMVRKKQGKSQIKYLKTKGKSRAGSRVRLGETMEFFENINERLQAYFKAHEVHRIAISCSKTLIPYLYSSKVATPFDKQDPRLFRIPKHIHTPIYEVLLDANRFLQRGELIYEEQQQELVDRLLADAGLSGVADEGDANEATAWADELDEAYFEEEEDDPGEWD
ncbi:hypothetical protein [Pontibacter flavimaris]|uniref:VLRF1 domain-containing protein n=1 Tax=Pontibacter flavimaris TaxID=1797110 RepID=A0A1Q5P9C1_9BACT|nr:hypothetical protein [Pontibacter flavimaris]OKL38828.1 hypothetical protein A3841_06060 [Pontibacter flavimaris]